MAWKNTIHYYGTISQILHWLMVFLILIMFTLGWGREFIDGPLRPTLMNLHKSLGIATLAIGTMRLLWRFLSPPPALPQTLTRAEIWAAHGAHIFLYLLFIGLPISGILFLNAFGQTISFFNLVELPQLLQKNREIGAILKELHATLAIIFSGIIGLHILAALFHHFIKKDDILGRMIPRLQRKDL